MKLAARLDCATVLLLAARFASNTFSRLASADLGRSVTIWDIDMEERYDNKLTETFVVKFSFNAVDGECAQCDSMLCAADCSITSLCPDILPSIDVYSICQHHILLVPCSKAKS